MSMISELLKTPAEARQEDIIKLQQVGSRTSANLRAAPQGQYSNLPGIFSNYAAGIADQQSTAADGLFRGMTQAGGQLARAAGGAGLIDQEKAAQLQQGLQNASMSGNERQAMQNQEIMAGVQGASDPVAAYSGAAKKAFAAGNQKLGMALEAKVGELQTAQVEAQQKERQMQLLESQEKRAVDLQPLNVKNKTIEIAASRFDLNEKIKGYETLTPEAISTMGLPEGSIAQRRPNGKLDVVFEGKGGEGSDVKNVVWAEGADSGETFRIGQLEGNNVKLTDTGIVPVGEAIRPVKTVTRVENPTKTYERLSENLDARLKPMKASLDAVAVINKSLDLSEYNPKAFGNFKRAFVKLTGPDSQISQLEINQVTGGGSLTQRYSDAVSIFSTGTPTEKSIKDFADVISQISQIYVNKQKRETDGFLQIYNGSGDKLLSDTANQVVRARTSVSNKDMYVKEANSNRSGAR